MSCFGSDPQTNGRGEPSPASANQRYYGKYSGSVLDNVDLMGLYRLKVRAPAVPATLGGVWARPCVPYFGQGVGFFAIPPVGARVWVEFEAGNPSLPIWVGGFWDEDQFKQPVEDDPEGYPEVKIWKTEHCRLVLRDQEPDGEVLLEILDPAVETPVRMKFYGEGVELVTGVSKMTVNPESGFVLSVGEDTKLTLSPEGISLRAPEITEDATGKISASAGGAFSAKAGEDASLKAGGALQMGADGEFGLEAGGLGRIKTTGDLIARGDLIQVIAAGDLNLSGGGAAGLEAGAALDIVAGAAMTIDATLDINQNGVTMLVDAILDVNGVILEDGDPVLVAPV